MVTIYRKDSFMEEEWRDIKGYEGLYQVSNFGRVYNVLRGTFLHQCVRKNGYQQVTLCKAHSQHTFRTHRLVAEAFIPNPDNYTQINHKDEDKTNNCVDNLEWCDAKYNINYGSRNSKVSKSLTGHKFFGDFEKFLDASKTPEAKAKAKKTRLERGSMLGEKNPFYGRHHSEEFRQSVHDRTAGTLWVTNYEAHKNKQIRLEELPHYLELGYVKGFTKWGKLDAN